jgi:MarR family transcriptional regulator, lower aerobic nicotinate degradation pathway regulator
VPVTSADTPVESATDGAAFDALVEVSFAIQDLLARTADRYGLSLSQLRLLGILRDREPTMLSLARHLHLEKSSASGLIDRAEQRGLVIRKPGAQDRRTIRVAITPEGRRLVERIERALAEPSADLLVALNPRQRRQLTRLLRSLLGPDQLGPG